MVWWKLAHADTQSAPRWPTWFLIVAGCLAALAMRLAALDFVAVDVRDWVIPWYDFVRVNGVSAFGLPLPGYDGPRGASGTYPPPYAYLLYLVSRFHGIAPTLYLIKAVSIAFDFVAAGFAFATVLRVTHSTARAWFAQFLQIPEIPLAHESAQRERPFAYDHQDPKTMSEHF